MDNNEESQRQQIKVLLPGHCELVDLEMASEGPRHVHIFTISGAICGGEDAEPESGVKLSEMRETQCINHYKYVTYSEYWPLFNQEFIFYLSLAEDAST